MAGITATTLWNIINRPEQRAFDLKEPGFRNILMYLMTHFPWIEPHYFTTMRHMVKDPIYHSFAPIVGASPVQIGVDQGVISYVKDYVVGRYRFYRPSLTYGGMCFVGRLDIVYNESTQAFETLEFYRGWYVNEHHQAPEDDTTHTWRIRGRLIAYSKRMFYVVSVAPGTNILQVKYINDVYAIARGEAGVAQNVSYMTGFVADMHGHDFYVAPMLFSRMEDGEMDTIGMVKNENIRSMDDNTISAFFDHCFPNRGQSGLFNEWVWKQK